MKINNLSHIHNPGGDDRERGDVLRPHVRHLPRTERTTREIPGPVRLARLPLSSIRPGQDSFFHGTCGLVLGAMTFLNHSVLFKRISLFVID